MDSYVVDAPPGSGWMLEADRGEGVVRFSKRAPPTIIQVSQNRVAKEELWRMGEEAVATHYREQETGTMMVRGPLENLYVLQDPKEDTTTVGGRKLYTLSYRTVGTHFGKVNTRAILYLYFPPDFGEKHDFFLFLISLSTGSGDSYAEADLAPILEVIKSFRRR